LGISFLNSNFSFDDVHAKIPRTIARLAREAGVQRLIHFSALNASPNPPAIIVRKPSKFLQSKVKKIFIKRIEL
jgi:NADH dehydrogenase (ubiquinone) 1 alpha subcomplex subunit 9